VPAIQKTVLHIDDSADDLFLFKKACSQAAASFHLQLMSGGKDALSYLQGAGQYSDRSKFPRADFILLDLKMPVPDGFSVLRSVRERSELNPITICIFTSSFQYEDIQETYANGADCFLTKPAAFESLVAIAGAIDEFLNSARLDVLKELPEFRQ